MNKIDWNTGTPLENGVHLVRWYEYDDNLEQVIAWCKLSDIEPYKSE